MTGTDSATQAVNALAQVYGIAAHHQTVAFIQVEHGFFEAKVETSSNIRNTVAFGRLLRYPCVLKCVPYILQLIHRAIFLQTR